MYDLLQDGDHGSHDGAAGSQIGEIDSQVGDIIYKKIENKIENKIEKQIEKPIGITTCEPSVLTIDNFILDPSIDSVNKIDFDGSSIEIKSSLLSYWYNCIDNTPISKNKLLLFNQSDYYKVVSRIFKLCNEKFCQPKKYLDVDINDFILYINICYDYALKFDAQGRRAVPFVIAKQIFFELFNSGKTIDQFLNG